MAHRIHVIGKVQGVFFRAETQRKAEQLRLKGWVKNNVDGSVDIHAEGPEDAVQALIDWARTGPENATVASIEVTQAPDERHASFDIRRD